MGFEYRHITVEGDQGEEVVIQAGVRDKAPAAQGHCEAPAGKAAQNPAAAQARTEPAAAASGEAQGAGCEKRAAGDGYHETTLQDIESAKMPKTQLAVVIAAIVIVVVAVAYIFVTGMS